MPSPNFFIIGSGKCGTTALHQTLALHPQIFMSREKEPRYYAFPEIDAYLWHPDDHRYWKPAVHRDRRHYESLFAGSDGFRIRGESSPVYSNPSLYAAVARRIAADSPHARLLYVIRQPVERLYSSYHFNRQLAIEPLGELAAAMAAGPARLAQKRYARPYYSTFLEYADVIQCYRALFGASQVLVVLHDDFRTKPQALLHAIANFLGVDPTAMPPAILRVNDTFRPGAIDRIEQWRGINRLRHSLLGLIPPGGRQWYRMWRSRQRKAVPPIDPTLFLALTAEFRPAIEQLADYLQQDLSTWLKPRETAVPR